MSNLKMLLCLAAFVAMAVATHHESTVPPDHSPQHEDARHRERPHPHPPLCKAMYEDGTVLRERQCPERLDMICELGPKEITDRHGDKLEFYACMPKPCKEVTEAGEVKLEESCSIESEACSVGPLEMTVNGERLSVTFCNHSRHHKLTEGAKPVDGIPVDMSPHMYNVLTGWDHNDLSRMMEFWAHHGNQLRNDPPCRVVEKDTPAGEESGESVMPVHPCRGQTEDGEDLCVDGPNEVVHQGKKLDAYYCKKQRDVAGGQHFGPGAGNHNNILRGVHNRNHLKPRQGNNGDRKPRRQRRHLGN